MALWEAANSTGATTSKYPPARQAAAVSGQGKGQSATAGKAFAYRYQKISKGKPDGHDKGAGKGSRSYSKADGQV